MSKEAVSSEKQNNGFLYSIWFGLVLSIIFVIIYSIIFYLFKDKNLLLIPADINRTALDYFLKYGIFVSVLFGIIIFLKTLVLWFLSFILRLNKYRLTKPFIYAINFKTCAIFGFRLVYFEPRNTSLAIGIIEFFAKPLFYTSIVMLFPIGVWFLAVFFKIIFKKK